jgi:hypothetical protein
VCSISESRILQAYILSVLRQLVSAAIRAAGCMRNIIDCALATFSNTDADTSRKVSHRKIESSRKAYPHVSVTIDETAYDSSMKARTDMPPEAPVASFGENTSRIQAVATATIASGEAYVAALRQGSVVESAFLDLISRLHSLFGTCFIVERLAFHKTSI